MTTPTTNSSREVDTTLPEFSWIPFFRELAVRLRDDGWEHRQQEIVDELQRVVAVVPFHHYVSDLEDQIDPFSLIAQLNRGITFDNQLSIAQAYRDLFDIESPYAVERPFLPTIQARACFYFSGKHFPGMQVHWRTLESALVFDVRDPATPTADLISRLDASAAVPKVGAATLSSALYWIAPNQFLRTDTIDAVLGDWPGYPHGSGFGQLYLDRLRRVLERDGRPFPIINNEQRLVGQFEATTDIERLRVYAVPAGADIPPTGGSTAVAVAHDTSGGSFGSIRRGDIVLVAQEDDVYRYGFAASSRAYDATDDAGNQASMRTVYWRPEVIHAPDLDLKAGDSVEPVDRGKVDLLLQMLGKEVPVSVASSSPSRSRSSSPASSPCPWSPVFLDAEANSRMLRLLRAKRNIVLQGPPGVGKTYIARKLARTLIAEVGNEDDPCDECELSHGDAATYEDADESIRAVQFHQSYSYEDFVGGYRPGTNAADQLVFEASDGAFLRLCEDARSEPDQRFVMLIDEVNRGNLSRVFGELMMLIEPDKRNDANAVELQHRKAMKDVDPDAEFYVPDNVYIIGTMNLADRSLTGMNVAMRRRFAFFQLEPQFANAKFARHAQARGMPPEMLARIVERLPALNEAIAADYALGRQYAVGHSFFVPTASELAEWEEENWQKWYDEVIEFEVRPLLEEYWFDKPENVTEEIGKLKPNGISD